MTSICLDTQTVLYLCQAGNPVAEVLPTSPLHMWRIVLKRHKMANLFSPSQSEVYELFPSLVILSTFFFFFTMKAELYRYIFSEKIANIDKFHFFVCLCVNF